MSEQLDKVTDDNFFKEVIKSDKPVLVDFFSQTCGPCMEMMPIIEEISKDYVGKVKFAALKVDTNQKITQQFGIMGIPTFLFFKDGKVVEQVTGIASKDKIKEIIDSKLIS